MQIGRYAMPPTELNSTAVGNRMHVDHCIETLRLALMCFADVTPILMLNDPSRRRVYERILGHSINAGILTGLRNGWIISGK
jgi:hypothetical protein